MNSCDECARWWTLLGATGRWSAALRRVEVAQALFAGEVSGDTVAGELDQRIGVERESTDYGAGTALFAWLDLTVGSCRQRHRTAPGCIT